MDLDKPHPAELAKQHQSASGDTSVLLSDSKSFGLPPTNTSCPYPSDPVGEVPSQYPQPSAPPIQQSEVASHHSVPALGGHYLPSAQQQHIQYHQPQQGPAHQSQHEPSTPSTYHTTADHRKNSENSENAPCVIPHSRPSIKVEEKSLLEAYILCFPLGILGLHHFYLGRLGMGFLYFFTFGLFGIGWVVDLIRLPWLVKQTNKKRREDAERGYVLRAGSFYDLDDMSCCSAYLYWIPPVGVLGGHHYYLGRLGYGITYSLTLGLFGIGWLIDMCRLPVLTKRANEDIRTLRSGRPLALNNGDRMHLDDAYSLAFPLGFLGLHHFYMRRWVFGVVYFFTFGCMGVGYLVDLCRLPYLLHRTKRELATNDIRFHLDDAYLMWFPLGMLGLHHFYLHRWVWGLAYFFTFGCFGIGWLIDICRLPNLVKKCNEKRESRLLNNQCHPYQQPPSGYTEPASHNQSTEQDWNQQVQTSSDQNMAVYAFPLDPHGHPIWTQGVSWTDQHGRDPSMMPTWLRRMPLLTSEPPPPYSQTGSNQQIQDTVSEEPISSPSASKDCV